MKAYFKGWLVAALAAAFTVSAQTSEGPLLAALKSDASRNEKIKACHELGRVGTAAAVAPLAALLDNPELAHAARYGLEMIPDPAVDAALRAAAGRLNGLLLAGVLQSVGNRRDAAAVPLLAPHLTDADPAVAAAAAIALGKIATPEAAAALKPLLGKSPLAAEAYLNGADAAPTPQAAVALYGDLIDARPPVQKSVRMAALRGRMLASGADGLGQWSALIASADHDEVDIALRVALEFPRSAQVTQSLAAALPRLPARQVRLCEVLGERGDPAAVPALAALAQAAGTGTESRLAAVKTLTRLGAPEAVPVLTTLALSDDAEAAAAARDLLVGFPGAARDAAVLALLDKPDAPSRLAGVELATRCRLAAAVPALLRLAGEADPQLAAASFKGLGVLAEVKDLPALLALLQKASSAEDAERTVTSLCARQLVMAPDSVKILRAVYGVLPGGPSKDVSAKVMELAKAGIATFDVSNETFGDAAPGKVKAFELDYAVNGVAQRAAAGEGGSVSLTLGAASVPPAVIEPLLAAYAQAQGEPKVAVLRILCSVRGPQVLAVVRQAAGSADATLKEAAQRALCDWPSAEVLPDLEAILQSDAGLKLKVLALRGVVKLVPAQKVPLAQKVEALKRAAGWAARDEERRLVQATLDELDDGASDETGFVPMCNGKDLTGWQAQGSWWKVVEGVLTAESTAATPLASNNHLVWTGGTPGDFELRTEFRLSKSANSGIQLRAEPVADRDTGYQADMNGGGNFVGFLYHPKMHLVGGRGETVTIAADGKKSAERFADSAALQKLYKVEDWNTYRIVCKGPEITLYVNGEVTSRFADHRPDTPRQGAITLQLHKGPPMKIEYRNLRIKTLKAE